jgi:predicted Zn finger-like uncharacterized protein
MADKIAVECPACLTKLNIADSALGKKIKCPKCQEVFKPEPIDEDDELETPSSRKRAGGGGKGSSKSSKKAGKGKSSEGGSSAPLIITGVVALLVVIGVGLYFSGIFNRKPDTPAVAAAPMQMPTMPAPTPTAAGPSAAPVAPKPVAAAEMTPAEKILGLRWMPAVTGIVFHVKVADLLDAPLVKGLMKSMGAGPGAGNDQFKQKLGLAPEDIESFSVGIVDPVGSLLEAKLKTGGAAPNFAGNLPMGPPVDFQNFERYLGIVKARKPIDLKVLASTIPDSNLIEKSGKPYLDVNPKIPMQGPWGGWLPDAQTLIVGSPKEVAAAMEKGETVTQRKELTSIDPTPQFLAAAVVRRLTPEELKKFDSIGMELPGAVVMVTKANEQHGLQMASVGLTIKGGFDVKLKMLCNSIDAGSKMRFVVEPFIGQAKTMFEPIKKTAPPLIAELGEMLLTNLKLGQDNELVEVSTGIPDSEQQKLEQLPAIVMLMAMSGGLSNFGSGPKSGAPFGAGSFPGGINPGVPGNFAPQPGETDSVESAAADGLPDGLKISAKTAWSSTAAASGDGAKSTTLDLLVDVTGDGLNSICGATGITTKTFTLDAGGTLKKLKKSGNTDFQKAFAFFDVNETPSQENPPQTLRVRIAVEAPPAGATKISVLEGSFKLLSSNETKELEINEVPKKAKRPLADPELKLHEIKLRRGPAGASQESYGLVCGKDHFLGRAEGNPGNIRSVTEYEKDQTVQRLYSNHEGGKFPDDFQIKFTIHPNVKEQTITFKFENVPLPAAESKPQ